MKNRIELAQYFNELKFKRGAEIGVADGRFSQILCENIPDLRLLCIDAYEAYADNSQDGTQAQQNECFKIAQRRLRYYNASFITKMSLDALLDVDDDSLDFVYIDANHKFDYVIQDIINWNKKVKSGGIISGHDYWSIRDFGVKEAVDIYTKVHNIKLNVIPGEDSRRLSQAAPNWWFFKT